jgi:hypothetical protein
MTCVKAGVVFLGVALAMAACSTDQSSMSNIPTGAIRAGVQTRSAGCPSDNDIKSMIKNLFPPGSRGTATSSLEGVLNAYKHGDVAGAQALAAQLFAFTMQQSNAGALTGAGTPAGAQAVVAFGDGIFCNAGLTINLSSNLNDNVVAIVPPNTDTIIKTGTANAGLQLFAAQQLPQEVVVITRLPDNAKTATCPQFSGPLCTPLAQFPRFYDYSVSPAPQLGASAPPFIVEDCVDTTQVHVPLSQLFIAHNVGPDSAQVLPKATGMLGLACDGGLGMTPRRSLFELARNGDVRGLASELGSRLSDFAVKDAYAIVTGTGVTGKTKSFSPFGIVDVNDFIAYQNGGWTYHAPTLATVPPPPGTGDIAGFQAPAFVLDASWVPNTSAFGNAPFGSGSEGFGCTLSALPNLHTVWPSFPAPTSTGNLDQDSSSIFLLRSTFFVPAAWSQDLQIGIAVDNDVEVFVNGTAVTPTNGATPLFVTHEGCAAQDAPGFVFAVPQALLVKGQQNLVAIRARDRGGESYIDARLSPTTPLTPAPSP